MVLRAELGGELFALCPPDGGIGQESMDAEKMPLLAMLPPSEETECDESWLERLDTVAVGSGERGKVVDSGETSKGLMGLEGRFVLMMPKVVISGGGREALSEGRVMEGEEDGWVTGAGRSVVLAVVVP